MGDNDETSVRTLTTDLFYTSLTNFIDYNKPDPIVRKQLESWQLNWEGHNFRASGITDGDEQDSGTHPVDWNPTDAITGTLEIRGDYVAVMLEMKCIWADGEAAQNNNSTEDGRLYFTCRLKSGKLIEKKEDEEKTERKIRKKMVSRLRQDSYIMKLLGSGKESKSSADFLLFQASIYVNAEKFELEERVDVSQNAAEILRRSLWSSTTSSLDIVGVMLSLPTLPCRSAGKTEGTSRLANRAKLRLLEDAMLDECEKEGEGQLIEDLKISNPKESNNDQQPTSDGPSRKKKKPKR